MSCQVQMSQIKLIKVRHWVKFTLPCGHLGESKPNLSLSQHRVHNNTGSILSQHSTCFLVFLMKCHLWNIVGVSALFPGTKMLISWPKRSLKILYAKGQVYKKEESLTQGLGSQVRSAVILQCFSLPNSNALPGTASLDTSNTFIPIVTCR